ncbi:hypothetical protein [Natronobacterium gregoryi]|uniref:Sporulation control protein n=2 Tax=Natronobacterium gregoryi TaxID=44930 RepID=L0AC49_NATGS|nr:hypothetical protein [Natronobacterium gregoryi]AFZ71478.1 hypothetical protein Natgr_0217 [Natronobacterium gregoryi SP2]ELY66780.1 sporulation control protein [Natronobacterium gregoryi SP2]PLK19930.1 sporulation control protein [Natronobacterium gregoryi SP2]SFJ36597.1 hypothetical protein SAMN05443661_12449 [Natronobacterium gregoryi]
MPAIGIGAPIYLVVQAFIARFVYREAVAHDRRSPLVIGISAFVFSIVAALLVESVFLVVLVQAVAIGLYLIGVSRNRPNTISN